MDLRARLRRWAYAHPRVLVVEASGQRSLRWAVESAVDDRGWTFAESPADADVLIVVGEADPALAEAVEVIWSQVARPRSRVSVIDPALVDDQLDAALLGLMATPPQDENPSAADAEAKLGAAPGDSAPEIHGGDDMGGRADPGMGGHAGEPGDGGHGGPDMDMGEHAGHGMGGQGGHDMDMGGHGGHDMDMGEHAGHDMGGHGMHHGGMVAGLPMAQTAQDRDGLDLDVLSVSLGPILPGWPTGLMLRAQMQGDVLNDVVLSWTAGAESAAAGTDAFGSELTALDHLAQFLMVAGWPRAARRARRVRSDLTSTDPAVLSRAQGSARRLAEQVRRSRVLAWSLRGVGSLQGADVLGRVHRWCDSVAQPTRAALAMPIPLAELAAALDGTELAATRLIVASFELDRTTAARQGTVAGV